MIDAEESSSGSVGDDDDEFSILEESVFNLHKLLRLNKKKNIICLYFGAWVDQMPSISFMKKSQKENMKCLFKCICIQFNKKKVKLCSFRFQNDSNLITLKL